MKYLVTHQEQESGPFTLAEIITKVRGKELDLFDYIYDQAQQDWVLLMEHPELAQKLKSNKPPRPPKDISAAAPTPTAKPIPTTGPATTSQGITEWFVLKGENKFGPFAYAEVLKMLQQKVVFAFDFIWHTGLQDWKRLAEMDEFRTDKIRETYKANTTDAFLEREHKRHKFSGRVLIHDNRTVWQGTGFEISKGGVGLTMTNALVVPGQEVYVHFTGGGELPAFNAYCEVVAKKFVSDDQPIEYGLRFLRLSPEVQDEFYKKVA